MTTRFVTAWRKNDPKLEAEAKQIWGATGVLPDQTTPDERAKEIALIAYQDNKLAAISTLNVRPFDYLRQKFAFVRLTVLPEFRKLDIGRVLLRNTFTMIQDYAKTHPEEQIAGVASVLIVAGIGKYPIGREIRHTLIGYTPQNEQIRVTWFDHFEVPPNAPNYTKN
jgi:GNAT superfamily N-acetyltransferase